MTDLILDYSNEIWKPIPGLEDKYHVSDYGRVRSLPYSFIDSENKLFRRSGKIMVPSLNSRGYMIIRLTKEKKRLNFTVHRLVMYAFTGKRNLLIDHINEVKTDNRLSNLQYVTNGQNILKGKIKRGRTFDDRYIHWHKKDKVWVCQIHINNKFKRIGSGKDKELVKLMRDVFLAENPSVGTVFGIAGLF